MGLDVDLFEESVGDEFLCKLCRKVLLNPIVAGCAHVFCEPCLLRRIKSKTGKAQCPTCTSVLDPDAFLTSSIEFKLRLLNLKVRCSHNCGESFALGDLPDHDEVCPYTPVQCKFRNKGCKKTVRRSDLQKHLDECECRTVQCEACGYVTIYRELFTHQSRVRCLEKKLKQQIIRERRVSSQQIQKHRDKMFHEKVRLEQEQRKRMLEHAKQLNNKPTPLYHSKSRFSLHRSDISLNRSDLNLNLNDSQHNGSVFVTESPLADNELPDPNDDRHMGRTPHSSRSGFVLQSCGQCGKFFRANTNHHHSCRWHAGPMIEVFGGTCCACGRLDYQPGCVTGFHRA